MCLMKTMCRHHFHICICMSTSLYIRIVIQVIAQNIASVLPIQGHYIHLYCCNVNKTHCDPTVNAVEYVMQTILQYTAIIQTMFTIVLLLVNPYKTSIAIYLCRPSKYVSQHEEKEGWSKNQRLSKWIISLRSYSSSCVVDVLPKREDYIQIVQVFCSRVHKPVECNWKQHLQSCTCTHTTIKSGTYFALI